MQLFVVSWFFFSFSLCLFLVYCCSAVSVLIGFVLLGSFNSSFSCWTSRLVVTLHDSSAPSTSASAVREKGRLVKGAKALLLACYLTSLLSALHSFPSPSVSPLLFSRLPLIFLLPFSPLFPPSSHLPNSFSRSLEEPIIIISVLS